MIQKKPQKASKMPKVMTKSNTKAADATVIVPSGRLLASNVDRVEMC